MKHLLTIEAHGDNPEDALRHVAAVLRAAIHDGHPRDFVIGDSRGSAGATWRQLTFTDNGDPTTSIRRAGSRVPAWLDQALNGEGGMNTAMKLTVWTSPKMNAPAGEGVPKCIFSGQSPHVPRVGEYVICRDGFGAERVVSVIVNLPHLTAEITVNTCDPANDYGPCILLNQRAP